MNYYYSRPKFRFYPEEKRDILMALGVLTLAFWILISGGARGFHPSLLNLLIALLSVIIAFFLHEMAHKYVAMKYGYPAAFKAWKLGLLIALLSSFVGFLFAAPGAVYIYGYPSIKENGKISAAGPITNLIAGYLLFTASLLVSFHSAVAIMLQISYLNFFLAFFNLLPIGPMDGLKIMRWSIPIYIILLALSILGVSIFYIPYL